jgi:hypothetical protein
MSVLSLEYRRQAVSRAALDLRATAAQILTMVSGLPSLPVSFVTQFQERLNNMMSTIITPYESDTHLQSYWDVQFPELAATSGGSYQLLTKMAAIKAGMVAAQSANAALIATGQTAFTAADTATLVAVCTSIVAGIPE